MYIFFVCARTRVYKRASEGGGACIPLGENCWQQKQPAYTCSMALKVCFSIRPRKDQKNFAMYNLSERFSTKRTSFLQPAKYSITTASRSIYYKSDIMSRVSTSRVANAIPVKWIRFQLISKALAFSYFSLSKSIKFSN